MFKDHQQTISAEFRRRTEKLNPESSTEERLEIYSAAFGKVRSEKRIANVTIIASAATLLFGGHMAFEANQNRQDALLSCEKNNPGRPVYCERETRNSSLGKMVGGLAIVLTGAYGGLSGGIRRGGVAMLTETPGYAELEVEVENLQKMMSDQTKLT